MANKKNRNDARLQELLEANRKSSKNSYLVLVAVITVVVLAGVIAVIVGMNSQNQVKHPSENADLPVKQPNAIWNQAMTYGADNAENHFVEYSDIFCPYCDKFAMELHANLDEMKAKYFDNQKVKFELRILNSLDYGEKVKTNNSTMAGSYAYCAAEQNKFWDWYEPTLQRIKREYFDKGIGAYHGAPDIEQLKDSFFLDQAGPAGLDVNKLTSCVNSGEGEKQVVAATRDSQKDAKGGLPYFRFNKFTTSGFNGDFDQIKQMFEAGLAKK